MRIAVTGTRGQLARALREEAVRKDLHVATLGRPDLDLAEPSGIASILAAVRPDVVVNAAAYTNVDGAESETDLAFSVNSAGAGAVAAAAGEMGIPVIQISTDYVFDGSLDRPYREEDAPAPANAYGRSKHAGERAVAEATENHVILRTSWLYSPFGRNFLRTMLRLAETQDSIFVVDDQVGAPTCANDIAVAILAVAANLCRDGDPAMRGVFHVTAAEDATWAAFARAVFRESAARDGPRADVVPIATADFPTAAARPANSRLDCRSIAHMHGVGLPRWQESVGRAVKRSLAPR